MAIYDDLRAKIEELGGSSGQVGSININGGREIKVRYHATPQPGFRVHHVVPYLVGESPDPSGGNAPVQRLLVYQYQGPTQQSPDGWRCFKVELIDALLPNPAPRPNNLETLDQNRQNCVTTW